MKKYLLIVLFASLGFAQTGTTTAGQFKMNTPVLGSKFDSLVVWNGVDKKLKFIKKNDYLSTLNFNPANYDLEQFTNFGFDPFVKQSELIFPQYNLQNVTDFGGTTTNEITAPSINLPFNSFNTSLSTDSNGNFNIKFNTGFFKINQNSITNSFTNVSLLLPTKTGTAKIKETTNGSFIGNFTFNESNNHQILFFGFGTGNLTITSGNSFQDLTDEYRFIFPLNSTLTSLTLEITNGYLNGIGSQTPSNYTYLLEKGYFYALRKSSTPSRCFILTKTPEFAFDLSTSGAVTSVNAQTGVVSLNADNIPETANRKWQTANQNLFNDATSSIQSQINAKQDVLISGTNIKTLENLPLLGQGNIDLSKTDVGLGNVDNTNDIDKPLSNASLTSDANVQAFSTQRVNHTGTQTASTISDFTATARNNNSFVSGPAGYNSATGVISIPTTTSQLTNNSGFLTNFTETDPIVKAVNGIVKSNGTTISSAVANIDYATPNQNTTGTASNITASTNSTLTSLPNLVVGQNQVANLTTALELKQNDFTSVNKIEWNITNASAGLWLGSFGSSNGTFANITSTLTNNFTRWNRSRYSNIASTTNQSLGQAANTVYSTSTGYRFYANVGFDTWTNGCRMFIGATASVNSLNVNPSIFNNSIGFVIDDTDNGLISFVCKNATTMTKISTGLTAITNKGYKMEYNVAPEPSIITYKITDVTTGVVVTGFLNTNLPISIALVNPKVLAGNASLTAVNAIQFSINKIILESNY